jgi:uncharacterized protein
MPPVIPPSPGRDDQYFWDGVAEGKLLLRRCVSCQGLQHPPAPMCGSCHGLDWETQEASGRGTVYTYVVSKHPSAPDADPRIVALIELEEGIRLISNLQGMSVDEVRNDMPVEVTFTEMEGGTVLPQFVAAGSEV